jgi:hypothetical protein
LGIRFFVIGAEETNERGVHSISEGLDLDSDEEDEDAEEEEEEEEDEEEVLSVVTSKVTAAVRFIILREMLSGGRREE